MMIRVLGRLLLVLDNNGQVGIIMSIHGWNLVGRQFLQTLFNLYLSDVTHYQDALALVISGRDILKPLLRKLGLWDGTYML